MGSFTSKSKTKNDPWAPAQPYILNGLKQTQDVFDQQQPVLDRISGLAQGAFDKLAPGAFGANPFVQSAQDAAGKFLSGAYMGSNPGAATYQRLQMAQDPSQDILMGLAGGSQSPSDYSGIGRGNPAISTLGGMAGDTYNPGLGSLARLQNGGSNNATGGLTALGYGAAAGGAGDDVLRSLAAGNGDGTSPFAQFMGGGAANPGDRFATDVAGGKYLGANPGASYYKDVLGGKYLDAGNPYLQSRIDATRDSVTKAANQRFSAAGMGAGLSSAFGDVLTRNLANSENSLRYQDYDAERARMQVAGSAVDSAFASERGQMTAATGQLSSNFNSAQDRALSAAHMAANFGQAERQTQLAAAQSLSSGSRDDRQTQLAALGQLGAANNQNFANRLNAGTALGSLYGAGQDRQLSAATGLGSLYNQTGQLGLAARQAADSSFQADRAAQLAAGTQLGQQWLNGGNLALNAAQTADQSQQSQLQQILAALGLTPGLRESEYAGVSPALALLNSAAETPWLGVQAYNGGIRTNSQGYGTTTTTSSPGLGQSILGGLGSAVKIGSDLKGLGAFSDRRLKTEVRRVGQTDDGLGVYTYRYRWGGPVQMGVMADEVAALRPDALGASVDGFGTVLYEAL